MQRLICPNPVSLLEAKKSTLVFMFSRELPDATTVLTYREVNGPKPDRAFRLKNSTGISLPKGPISIDMETPVDPKFPLGRSEDFGMGKAIFEQTQPSQERLVVYATDMNVGIRANRGEVISSTISVGLKSGIGYVTSASRVLTEYNLNNVGDEDVEIYLDHRRTLPGSDVVVTGGNAHDPESLADGYFRTKVHLAGKAEQKVQVQEVYRKIDRVSLSSAGKKRVGGILTVIGHTKDKLLDNPNIKAVLAIAEKIDAKNGEIGVQDSVVTKLKARHQQAKSTLEALKNPDSIKEFEAEIMKVYRNLQAVENVDLPRLTKERDALESEYTSALNALVGSWADVPKKKSIPATGVMDEHGLRH